VNRSRSAEPLERAASFRRESAESYPPLRVTAETCARVRRRDFGSDPNYPARVSDEWDISDAEVDSWLEDWEAVDRAAAEYLAERIPAVRDVGTDEEARWVAEVAETISPTEEPGEGKIEAVSAVMALQHVDWLGLVLGVVRRGPGTVLDPKSVQTDIERLEEVEGEIEDLEGHLAVIEMALLHPTPLWQDLDVLDEDEEFTERGVWGLPRALHKAWID
jgi:hypothetical protein